MTKDAAGTARGSAGLTVLVARVPGGRRRLGRDLARLTRWAAAHAAHDLEVSFVVIDDERMAELHERYTSETGPTDVLSFPLADEPVRIGEVLVSVDTARREAAARGHPAYDELLLYAVHGLLHLVGYDDHSPADRRKMRHAERRALTALGLRSVFGSRSGARTPPGRTSL